MSTKSKGAPQTWRETDPCNLEELQDDYNKIVKAAKNDGFNTDVLDDAIPRLHRERGRQKLKHKLKSSIKGGKFSVPPVSGQQRETRCVTQMPP